MFKKFQKLRLIAITFFCVILFLIFVFEYYIIVNRQKELEIERQKVFNLEQQLNIEKNRGDIQKISFEIFNLINIARATRKLPELNYNSFLAKAGENHCLDILKYDYWDHNRNGKNFYNFVNELGIEYKELGEVLATNFISTPEIIDYWLKSETHKEIILGDFKDAGIGVVKREDGTLLVSGYFLK